MTVNLALVLIAVLCGSGLIFALAALVDRDARARAWRQIAAERRWNREEELRRPARGPTTHRNADC